MPGYKFVEVIGTYVSLYARKKVYIYTFNNNLIYLLEPIQNKECSIRSAELII